MKKLALNFKLLAISIFFVSNLQLTVLAQGFTGEKHEKYVGYQNGKYKLNLAGLQKAINSLPNDSGVVWIAYPGVDTLGLGILPTNIELRGWIKYCNGSVITGRTELQIFAWNGVATKTGTFTLTLYGDAPLYITITIGTNLSLYNNKIRDSINTRSTNWIAGPIEFDGTCFHVNKNQSASDDLFYEHLIPQDVPQFTYDTTGLNINEFIVFTPPDPQGCSLAQPRDGILIECNTDLVSTEIIDSLENYDRVTTNSNKSSITTINTNLNTWHSFASNIYKIGKPGRQLYYNNGAYSDFWIGGFVVPPYNLPYLVNIGNEYRTDYLNDTLKLFLNFQHLFYIDGTGTPRWGSTSAGFVNGNFGLAVGDLPDSVGLDWNWNDMVGVHVQMFDEVNKTAVAKRFPMPMYGFRFRFGGDINYYTFPYVYGYYSDFTSFGDQARVEKGWHFYGKGDFPIYNDGYIQTAKNFEVVNATTKAVILKFPNTDGSNGQVIKTDGSGNLSWQADNTGGGGGGLANIVEDITPQLGGALDMNDQNITNATPTFTITPTEIGELDGVTSNIQTQLNAKENADAQIMKEGENVSLLNNNAGYITDGNTNWDNSYGFLQNINSQNLNDLANVSEVAPSNDEVLQYVNDHWENQTLIEAGIEPSFSKNTAFNKNFGTITGTVTEGNDSRLHTHANQATLDAIPNHSGITTGYVMKKQSNGTVAWEADAMGGAPTWGSITGTIANQTDLQTALNAKSNTGHAHTAGDISSGILSTDRFSAFDDLIAETKIGTASTQVAAGNHNHNGVYEPAFTHNTAFNKNFGTAAGDIAAIGSTLGNTQIVETNGTGQLISAIKNTAYNKDFGTIAGTVAEGTHNHTGVYEPASANIMYAGENISLLNNNSGYITGNQTITLSGDVSGSGATSISTTIASSIARDVEITKETLAANGDISDGTITNGDDNTLPTEDDVYDYVNSIDFSGTATITIGNEVIVTHGVGSTPLIQDISITPQTTTFGFPYWVSNVTSTTFKINLGTVGLETRTADILFSWQIRRQ